METKFNFNSQVATTWEQSEKLLALGLKFETADMIHQIQTRNHLGDKVERHGYYSFGTQVDYAPQGYAYYESIPAWSLHRLLSMLPDNAPRMFWILDGANISIEWDNDGTDFFPHKGNMYDGLIDCIEWLIKEGYFNKEYLV